MPSTLELERLMTRFVGEASNLFTTFNKVESGFKHIERVADKSAKAVEQALQGMGKTAIGVAATIIGVGSAIDAVFSSVKLAAEAEQTEASFKVLVGSAELAMKTLEDIREFALETPFQTPELMESAKMMIAFGQSADTIVPALRMLGEVSAGVKQPLKEIAYLYSTLRSQGKAYTIDIRQFAGRGIPIYRELAKVMGLVPPEAKEISNEVQAQIDKMVEHGTVTFDIIEKAFQGMSGPGGQFFGQLDAQSKTLIGMFGQMREEIDTTLRVIGKMLADTFNFKDIMRSVSQVANRINTFLQGISPQTREAIRTIGILTAAFSALAVGIVAVKFALAFAFGPIGLIIGVITSAVGLTYLWVQRVGGLEHAWMRLQQAAEDFWNFVEPIWPAFIVALGPIPIALVLLIKYWDEVTEAVSLFWNEAQPVLRAVWSLIKTVAFAWRDGMVQGIELSKQALGGLVIVADQVWKRLGGGTVDWSATRDAIRDFVLFFEFAFRRMDQIAEFVWVSIRYGAIILVDNLMKNIFGVMAAVLFPPILLAMFVDWKQLWEKSGEILIRFRDFVKELFVGILTGSVNAINNALVYIKNALENFDLIDVAKLTERIKKPFEDAIVGAVKGIGDIKFEGLGFKIQGLQKERDRIAELYEKLRDKIKMGFDEFKKDKLFQFQVEDAMELTTRIVPFILKVFSGQGEAEAAMAGTAAGTAYAGAFGEAAKKWDAVLFGSTEALSRIEDYRNQFPANIQDRMRVESVAPPPNTAELAMVSILTTIAVNTSELVRKPPFQMIPAAVDN